MRNTKTDLIKLLESKRQLFEKMQIILNEQKQLLIEKELDKFFKKSEMVDNIIGKIKNIDYDIARRESEDENPLKMVYSDDTEVKILLEDIMTISKRNRSLIDQLTEDLKKSYRELKEELGDTVAMSRIEGYKTATKPSPVYFDKIN